MKTKISLICAASALSMALPASSAWASDGLNLAKKSNCMACHTVDKKLVGPSYQDVAKKYKDDKTAQASLEKKVKAGGKGTWGEVPMPPNAAVKDADIATLVKWILEGAK